MHQLVASALPSKARLECHNGHGSVRTRLVENDLDAIRLWDLASGECARVQADNLQLREELLQLRNELQRSRLQSRSTSSLAAAGDAAGATPPPRVAVRLRSSAGEEVAASILPTA